MTTGVHYSAGTITVTNGSTTVVGVGTSFVVWGIREGDWLNVNGLIGYISVVVDDTNLILSKVWPGPTIAGTSYDLEKRGSSTTIVENQTLLNELIQQIESGLYVEADASGTLAERSAYDDEPQGFVYRVLDDPSGNLVTYIKASATSGDWDGPYSMVGPPGADGADGDNGADGAGFDYTGSGVPSNGIGVDGNTYLNIDNGDTYLKTAGAWVLTGSIEGPQGESGLDGQTAGIRYTFSTDTTMENPGTAFFRFDQLDITTATAAAISDLSAEVGNEDMSGDIIHWADSTNPNKGILTVRDILFPENVYRFDITGLTDNLGWTQLAITYRAGSGGIANADDITVDFAQTGDKGQDGAGGDMFVATYDPTNVAGDAFAMDNMVEGATTKILTNTERSEIAANTAKVTNATHTGEVTGSGALTIAPNAVTLAKMAQVATNSFLGRVTAATGDVEALTVAQMQAVLSIPALGALEGINTQLGTAYTLGLTDPGKVVEMNNAAANILTVPPNSTIAFAINTKVDVVQYGAGVTTIAAGTGVTIRSESSNLSIGAQYSGVTLYKRGTDEWVLIGNLV